MHNISLLKTSILSLLGAGSNASQFTKPYLPGARTSNTPLNTSRTDPESARSISTSISFLISFCLASCASTCLVSTNPSTGLLIAVSYLTTFLRIATIVLLTATNQPRSTSTYTPFIRSHILVRSVTRPV